MKSFEEQGFIHRDLWTRNILVAAPPDEFARALVGDLYLTKVNDFTLTEKITSGDNKGDVEDFGRILKRIFGKSLVAFN